MIKLGPVIAAAMKGVDLGPAIGKAIQESAGVLSKAPAASSSGLPTLPAGSLDKILYIAVLSAALQSARGAANFNLETHVNDLWVKLDQIRQQSSQTKAVEAKVPDNPDLQFEIVNALKQIQILLPADAILLGL